MTTLSKKFFKISAVALAAVGAGASMSANAAQDFTIHGSITNGWNAWYSNNTNYNNFWIAGTSNYNGANSGVLIQNGSVNQLHVQSGAKIHSTNGTGLGVIGGVTQSADFTGASVTSQKGDALLVAGNNGNFTFASSTIQGHNGVRLAWGSLGNVAVNAGTSIAGDSCGFALNGDAGNFTVANGATVSGGSFGIWTDHKMGDVNVAGQLTSAKTALSVAKGGNVKSLTVQQGGAVSGDVAIDNAGTIGNVNVNWGASLKGTTAAIRNQGTMGSITVGGTIGDIINTGTINGQIKIFQEGTGANVTVAGNGQIVTNANNQSAIGFGGYTSNSNITLKDNAKVLASGYGLESWSKMGSVTLSDNATLQSQNLSAINNFRASTIEKITLSGNAKIIAAQGQGMWSAGTVKNGISLADHAQFGGNVQGIWNAGTIGNTDGVAINVADQAQVYGTTGAAIKNGDEGMNLNAVLNGDIVVAEGASLTGKYGFYNTARATVNGSVAIAGTTSAIENLGTITGDVAVTGSIADHFTNAGSIGGNVQLVTADAGNFNFLNDTKGTIAKSVAITLKSTGASSQNTITNKGHIQGDLTVSSAAQALASGALTNTIVNDTTGVIDGNLVVKASNSSVSNLGTIKGYLIVGASNVKVENFNTLSAQANETKTIILGAGGNALARSAAPASVAIDNLIVGVNGSDNGTNTVSSVDVQGSGLVKNVKQVTIGALGDNFELGQAIDFNNMLTTDATVATGDVATQNVVLSDNLKAAGYSLNTLADGQVVATRSLANTAGAIVGKVVASQVVRRDMLLDAMVAREAQNVAADQSVSAFAQVYGSKDSYNTFGSDVSGNTYGVLVGANVALSPATVVTGFAGYESSTNDGHFASGTGSMDMSTQYVGVNVSQRLATQGAVSPFVNVGAKMAYTSNEISRTMGSASATVRPNTWTYGVNVGVGANYALSETSVITPTVGLSYGTFKTDDFSLGTSEAYDLDRVNMLTGNVGVSWQQSWSKDLKTQVEGGMRYNFAQNGQTVTSGSTVDEYNTASAYEYVNVGLAYNMGENSTVSLGYQGAFDRMGASHGGMVKFEQRF